MESIKTLVRRPFEIIKSLFFPSNSTVHERLSPKKPGTDKQPTPPSLDELNLSPRVFNALRKAEIHKIETIASMSDESLLNIPGFGVKALTQLKERLAMHNISDDNTGQIAPSKNNQ